MKKKLLAGIVCVSILSGCQSTPPRKNEPPNTPLISGFNGYDWGTSFDEIKNKETVGLSGIECFISPNEYNDTYKYDEYADESIEINKGDFFGIESKIVYLFCDEKLVVGEFHPNNKLSEEQSKQINESIIEKYGDPKMSAEDTEGWGSCNIWIDDEQNILINSETLNVVYISDECPTKLYQEYSDQLDHFHGLNLDGVMNTNL